MQLGGNMQELQCLVIAAVFGIVHAHYIQWSSFSINNKSWYLGVRGESIPSQLK